MSTGGVGSLNLDTRLLRFRGRRGEEDEVALAEDLLSAGRGADAREVVTTALKAKPEDPTLLLLDGKARFATGDLLGAQAVLLKAARANPASKEPFRWLGEVLLKRGDPGRAAKVLERALAIDPSDRGVHTLKERAARLARVAAGAEDDTEDEPAVQERTVIRSDLTEQLRSMTQDVDAEEQDEAKTALAGRAYQSYEDDDEPTSVVPGQELADIAKQAMARKPAAPPAPARRPRIKKTLAFGSTESTEIPAPGPIPPATRPAVPVEDHGDGPSTRVEPVRAGAAATRTSPGAAAAPLPPPPKRQLPSAQLPSPPSAKAASAFAASEDEIDDALGALGGASGDPFGGGDLFGADPFAAPAPTPPAPPKAAAIPPPPRGGADPFAAPSRGPAPEPSPPPVDSVDPFATSPSGGLPAPDFGASGLGFPEHDTADFAADFAAEAAAPALVEDVALGGGDPHEDVDQILSMLRNQGLFEAPSGEAAQWANRGEVKAARDGGTRTGIWIGLAWVLAIGLSVGGWYGWQAWVEHRHGQAAQLVAQATREAYGGDHADLVDAERHLREARDLNPHDIEGPTLLLFVHAQRALEDGAFEAGFLRPTIARAEQLEGGEELPVYLDAARAVLAAAEGGHEQARTRIDAAREARPEDPAIVYLAGRLEQRLGGEDALTHLEAAAEGEANLNAARIALAEARYDEGQSEEALEMLGQILSGDAEHLRARLWRAFMTSDTEEPDAALSALLAMNEDLELHGAPTDKVLYELTRARLLRRQGNTEGAGAAVDSALEAGASEPRLLALVATEGRRAGRMQRAEQAARTAVTGAPSNPDFRKLLAEIQLARRNGRAALTTLAELDTGDPDVLEMRAQGALLVGTEEALTAAAEGLDAYVGEHAEDASVEIRALRIRMHVQLGQAEQMMADARALATEAPGDPSAALALGEAALRTFDAAAAVEALGQVVQAAPDDAEGHYLLGRARRMAADAEGAEASLRRAIELTPEHIDAKLALGGLLLDMGQFGAADELYTPLARTARAAGGQAVNVAGRLGRIEALIGLGSLSDAQVQLEQLQDDVRQTPSARMTAARLALARGRAGEALSDIRPLATAEGAPPAVLALYGDALLAAAQNEPAAEAYEAALAADSGLPEALLGQAELAVRSDRKNDALEALGSLERVLEQRIRPPGMRARMRVVLGRAHLSGGRSGAAPARDALRRAVELQGVPPEAYFFLGEALAGENSPESRSSYERYLELAPEGSYAARARRAIR